MTYNNAHYVILEELGECVRRRTENERLELSSSVYGMYGLRLVIHASDGKEVHSMIDVKVTNDCELCCVIEKHTRIGGMNKVVSMIRVFSIVQDGSLEHAANALVYELLR